MTRRIWYYVWLGLFLITAAMGFVPEQARAMRVLRLTLTVLFFLPPLMILRKGTKQDAKRIFALSAASLCLTVAAIVISVICARGSTELGNFLHGVLVVVSAPMICGGVWVLSLFLWACLMFACRGRFGELSKKSPKI